MLLVGGVSQNRAVIASLREKLPKTELVVSPESPYFEALGTAILTRREPAYTSPQLKVSPSMGTLPPLAPCLDRVRADGTEGKRGQAPFVRSTLRAVPANGACPLFPTR
jgi:hypothetical protein